MMKLRLKDRSLDVRTVECDEGVCLVQCEGELDIEASPRLREALEAGVRIASRRLVLDLRRVSRIDSSGVGEVVGLCKRLRPGTRLQVLASNPKVRMLLSMAGLGGVMSAPGRAA
ncbi:MAG: STAS domain-containing protein [Armatimonadetes bacterium]|nr:STAS domain-containing protein [Armatimonadota bacterium]